MTSTESSSIDVTHETAVRAADRTQTGLLKAQELLLVALRRPQPRRERAWAESVSGALAAALAALRDHRLEVEGTGGLYSELVRDAPWAASRARQIAAQVRRIESEIVDLQVEAARVEAGDTHGLPAIRADAERMLLSLHDLLGKEADLIYERFNEPGAGD